MRIRTSIRFAALAGIAALALAGCVSGGSGSDESGSSGGSGGDGSVVTVWSWFNKPTMQKAIDQFEADNPGVTVEYTYYNYDPEFITALKAAANSGTLPDIIGMQPGSLTQQYRDDLAPLNDLATQEWGDDWESGLAPVAAQQMRLGNPEGDNNVYMMPHETQVLGVWYNTKIFDELGLSVPTTMDELIATSKTLTDNGYMSMYQGAAGAWQNENVYLMLANQLKPGITDDAQAGKVPWTSPELVQAMTTWGELFTNGVFQPGALGAQAYPTGAQLFAAGKVGMFPIGSWFLQNPQLPDQPEGVQDLKDFGFFQFPSIAEGTDPGAIIGGIDIGLALTKNGEKNPNAWAFLADLVRGKSGEAAMADLNDLPAFTDVKVPTDKLGEHVVELYDQWMEMLPDAINQRFAAPEVQQAVDDALAGVAAGTLTPQDALAAVQKAQDSIQ